MRKATLLLILLLTACCGQPAQATTSIAAVMTEYQYSPAQWRVPAGQTIDLQLSNQGQAPLEWALFASPPSDPVSPQDEARILFRVTLQPGQKKSVQFQAPLMPGEYSVASSLAGQLKEGMLARLVVVQPGY